MCRHFALNQSKWVRREINAFEGSGRALRLIDVEGAVSKAIIDPPEYTAAAWLSEPSSNAAEGNRAVRLLRIDDRSGNPDFRERVPDTSVAHFLQRAFEDRRRKTARIQALVATLAVVIALAIGLAGVSVAAIRAANRAERGELIARLQLSAAEAERLSLTPDTEQALRGIVSDIALARSVLGSVPPSTRLAIWRMLERVRDVKRWRVPTAQVYAVGWDSQRKRIVTLERDGGVSAYSTDGVHELVLPPMGEDNARLSFTASRSVIQRFEGDEWIFYSLGGEKLFNHRPSEIANHYPVDVDPLTRRLIWAGKDNCLRITAFVQVPSAVEPIHCIKEDRLSNEGFDYVQFLPARAEIFYTSTGGTVRRVSIETGMVLSENSDLDPFSFWLLRNDGSGSIALRQDRIVRLDESLEIAADRSLTHIFGGEEEILLGAAFWEDDRLLTTTRRRDASSQLYTLDLEPVGPPFRLHTSAAIAALSGEGTFASVGYLDRTMRLTSTNDERSDLVLRRPGVRFAKLAYCKDSRILVAGDFDGRVHSIGIGDPSFTQPVRIGENVVDAVACLKGDGWAAITDGRLYSSRSFEGTPIVITQIDDNTAYRLAPLNDLLVLTSRDCIFLVDNTVVATSAKLYRSDAIDCPVDRVDGVMISSLATHPGTSQVVVGLKPNGNDAIIVALQLDRRAIISSEVYTAPTMDLPWAIAFDPDGLDRVVAGSTLRVMGYDRYGGTNWTVRGGDNPFISSLVFADDDFFVGAGFWGGLSLWSADGTIVENSFDPDLNGEVVTMVAGEPGEIFAADGNGTIKRLLFDTETLEARASSILRRAEVSAE